MQSLSLSRVKRGSATRKQAVTPEIFGTPVDQVFDTVVHIENFSKAVPYIVATDLRLDFDN